MKLRWYDNNGMFKDQPNYEPNLVLQQYFEYIGYDKGYWEDVEVVY